MYSLMSIYKHYCTFKIKIKKKKKSVYVKILNLMNIYEPHQLWCFYIEEPYIEKSSRAFK